MSSRLSEGNLPQARRNDNFAFRKCRITKPSWKPPSGGFASIPRCGAAKLASMERSFHEIARSGRRRSAARRFAQDAEPRGARLRVPHERLPAGPRGDRQSRRSSTSDASEIILVKDIELYSMCEHHLLPFIGKAHVAYIPNGKVIGLSKVARIVDVFARRLQIQEQLTTQIADALMTALHPSGRGGRDRSEASLHDDARGGETEFGHDHLVSARLVQRGRPDALRVPRPAQAVARLTSCC